MKAEEGNATQTKGTQNANCIFDPHCDGCEYYTKVGVSTTYVCDYILVEGHKRPCPPGEKCTVKSVKARRKPTWNIL